MSSLLLVLGSWLSEASATPGWTPYVSEEGGGPWTLCAADEVATGFDCTGGFCDNVSLHCDTLPEDLEIVAYHRTTSFSEEGDFEARDRRCASMGPASEWVGGVVPPFGTSRWYGAVTGMRCSGSNCDNMTLECAEIRSISTGEPAVIYEAGFHPLSEEDAPALFGDQVVHDVSCSGSYCDNVYIVGYGLISPALSCDDRCGEQAPGGCWCDSNCEAFGDCCEDESNWCDV